MSTNSLPETHTRKAHTIPDIAVKAASAILENGGETYRAEETAVRVAYALGAIEASAFVTPTVVIVSVTDETKQYHTVIRRIRKRGVNLTKISQVNTLSRLLASRERTSEALSAESMLDHIISQPPHTAARTAAAAAFCSMFFALMFGGSWQEALAALIIGLVLRIGLTQLEKLPVTGFIILFIAGCGISLLCELAFALSLIPSPVVAMTAVLMQVVPGLAIVNAIRDLIAGDLVSGVARATEAFVTAASLSAGATSGYLFFARFLDYIHVGA